MLDTGADTVVISQRFYQEAFGRSSKPYATQAKLKTASGSYLSLTPLYTTINQELTTKIRNGEFVDLKHLAPKRSYRMESNQRAERSLSLIPWARAFLRLTSQMAEDGTNVQDMLVHMDTVLALAEDRHAWEGYDFDFRKQQVNANYSFAHTRVELYAKAVSRGQLFRAPQNNQPKPKSEFQLGTCFKFHSPKQSCDNKNCPFLHKCPHCGGKHPQYRCFANARGRQEVQEPQPGTSNK